MKVNFNRTLEHRDDSIPMLLLIVLLSCAMGLIPIIYGLSSSQTPSQTQTPLGEAGLWNVMGER